MTDIVISVDLEFDVNNAFAGSGEQPRGRESIRDAGQPGFGLDAILDSLEEHSLRGVFFTEVLNTHHFGYEEMGAVAHELHRRGHELQLHMHPVWTLFADENWRDSTIGQDIRSDIHDNFAAKSTAQATELLEYGLDCFREWGLPRPVAFRTGNLMVSRDSYAAMAAAGIALSSSVGLRGFEGEAPGLQPTVDEIGGVLEIPVTRYEEIGMGKLRRSRLFTLTGCSRTALRFVPRLAHAQGISPLMLLTHASEFMPAAMTPKIAAINRQKFRNFCAAIAAEPGRYNVTTIDESLPRWRADRANQKNRLKVPLLAGVHSMVDRLIELKISAALPAGRA